MLYHWTFGQLKTRLNKLETLKKYLTNPNEVRLINADIGNIKEALDGLKEEASVFKDQPQLAKISDYSNYLQSIWYLLKDLVTYFANCYNPPLDFSISHNLNLTKEDVYTLTHDFYKDYIGGDIYQTFLKSYQARQNHTRFVPRSVFSGQTLHIFTFQETFMESQYEHSIIDVITLIHEHGHDIHFRFNFNQQNLVSVFQEMISLTMEILAFDYLENIPDLKKDTLIGLINKQASTYDALLNINSLIKIVITAQESLTNLAKLKKQCLKNYGINEQQFLACLDSNNLEEIIYMVGELVAMELRAIYYEDKDKFLDLLKKIMSIKTEDAQILYQKMASYGLKLNEHSLDYQRELQKKTTNFLKR